MKTLSRYVPIIIVGLSLFACSKQNDQKKQSSEPDIHPIKTINEVRIHPDSAVAIPIDGYTRVINFPYASEGNNVTQGRVADSDPTVLRDTLYIGAELRISSINGSSVNSTSYNFQAEAQYPNTTVNWYFREDNYRKVYLGSTNVSTTTTVLNFTQPMLCGHVYNIEAETYSYNPSTGTYELASFISTSNVKPIKTLTSAGFGNEGDGADVKITDINGNGLPDVLLMANDDPSGANTFFYKFLMDLNASGVPAYETAVKSKPNGMNDAEGSGAAIGLINNNSIPDLVFMAYDAPSGLNNFRYMIGWDVNANGDVTSWSPVYTIGGVNDNANGAGIALGDLDNNGRPEMILTAVEGAVNSSSYNMRLKVGMNLNTSGVAASWQSGYQIIGGNGLSAQGGGIDIGDLDNDGIPELISTFIDHPASGINNSFWTKVTGITTTGQLKTSNPIPLSNYSFFVGQQSQDGGVAIGDINRDGKKDIIHMSYDNPSGVNSFRYTISFGIILNPPSGKFFFDNFACY